MITSRIVRTLAAVAFAAGVAAWVRFLNLDLVLSHYDAKAHLVVARRVIDNITPGWQQIGAVWLPLPHLLQILPTQIDAFYRTGAFGSLLSIASFTVAVWAAARLIVIATGSAVGAVTGAALLILNPNLLYLQSTPMTEPLLLAAVFVVVLWLYEWLHQAGPSASGTPPRVPRKLGWALFAATWTRYEAWLVVVTALALTVYVLRRQGSGKRAAFGAAARLGAWPAAAASLFIINSKISTGRWLLTEGFYEIDPTYHGLVLKSAIAVWWGTHRLSGYVVESVAIVTAAWLLIQSARRGATSARIIPLAVVAAAALPFYGFVQGHPFRVRYMAVLAAASALFCGIAVGLVQRRGAAVMVAAVVLASSLIESPPWELRAPMIEEAQWDVTRTIERRTVTQCLRPYRGEKILASMGSLAHYMQELSHDGFHISDFIHEGNGEIWSFALETGVAAHAGWMIVEEQSEGGDILARKVSEDAGFDRGMERVCEGGGVALYRRQ